MRIIFLFLCRAVLFWQLHVSHEEDPFIHSQCRAGFTKLDHEMLRWTLTCCLIQCSYPVLLSSALTCSALCSEHYKKFGELLVCWGFLLNARMVYSGEKPILQIRDQKEGCDQLPYSSSINSHWPAWCHGPKVLGWRGSSACGALYKERLIGFCWSGKNS